MPGRVVFTPQSNYDAVTVPGLDVRNFSYSPSFLGKKGSIAPSSSWTSVPDHMKDLSLLPDLLPLSLSSLPFLSNPELLLLCFQDFGYAGKHLRLKWDRLKAQWHATHNTSFSPEKKKLEKIPRGDATAQQIQTQASGRPSTFLPHKSPCFHTTQCCLEFRELSFLFGDEPCSPIMQSHLSAPAPMSSQHSCPELVLPKDPLAPPVPRAPTGTHQLPPETHPPS